jgi:hypothetical protein
MAEKTRMNQEKGRNKEEIRREKGKNEVATDKLRGR